MLIRTYMEECQYLWTFCFLLIILLIYAFYDFHYLYMFGICFLIYRIWTYYPKALLVFTIVLALVLSHYIYQSQVIDRLEKLNKSSAKSSYQLQLNPLNLLESGDKLKGQAKILLDNQFWLGVDVIIPIERLDKLQVQSILSKERLTTVVGSLSPIEGPENFSVFDYQSYQKNRGILWTLYVEECLNIRDMPKSLLESVRAIKIGIIVYFKNQTKTLWQGIQNKLLLNIDSSSYSLLKENLVSMGIIHFFAISGFHIQYLIKAFDYMLRRVGFDPNRQFYHLLPLLILYGWLISWPVGAIRAIGVYLLKHLAKLWQWPLSSMDRLAMLGILILIIQPSFAMDLGFILSFYMTFIVKFYLASRQAEKHSSLELSLTCLLFSWPILIGLNHQWNPWQILIIYLTGLVFESVIMPLALVSLVINIFAPTLLDLILNRLDTSLSNLFFKADFLGVFPVFTIGVRETSIYLILAMLGLAFAWLYFLSRNQVKRAYTMILVFYLVFVFIQTGPRLNSRITILDVDQGDAVLIQPGLSNENWLIDTGGKVNFANLDEDLKEEKARKFAQYTIISALEALGIRHIDHLILTHDDDDHIGNLEYLSEKVTIGHLYINDLSLAKVQKMKIKKGAIGQVHLVNQPITLQSGQGSLWLGSMVGQGERDSNRRSFIQVLSLSSLTSLFMADLPSELENQVLKTLNLEHIDIIKLGHHGSKTSSSEGFLKHIQPKLALISVGEDNHYGHPSTEVVQRLASLSIPYLSTGQDGAVQIIIDPFWGNIKIRTAK